MHLDIESVYPLTIAFNLDDNIDSDSFRCIQIHHALASYGGFNKNLILTFEKELKKCITTFLFIRLYIK